MTTSGLNSASARVRSAVNRSILALAVLTAALLLAPDDPRSQATICERHHSFDACRVW